MYLLLDIGGSKTRVAMSEDLKRFQEEPHVVDSSASFEEEIAHIVSSVKTMGGAAIAGVAVGMKGSYDPRKDKTMKVPGKPSWEGKNLASEFERAFGVRPRIANDTALVGLGEAHFGAGQGSDILAYMTVSTGVGGARIVHGKIDAAHFNFEPGHQIIDLGGNICPECNTHSTIGSGRLEEYSGGAAFEKRFGVKPHDVTNKKIWEEAAKTFAVGLHNTIVHWSPDTVVLGGSMIEGIKGPGIAPEDVAKSLKEIMWVFPEIPDIKKAALGDFGGLYGGMALLGLVRK